MGSCTVAELKTNMTSVDERADAQETFNLFDKDQDGKISLDELRTAMMAICGRATEEDIARILKAADVNGDGEIDFEEFYTALTKKTTEEDIEKAFKAFDKNNDGFITADELKQVIESFGHDLTDEELDEMIEGIDGKINYLEFWKWPETDFEDTLYEKE